MSRAPRDSSDKFSLFPFLAVLLCTMGALLVLLLGLTKAGRDRVAQQLLAQQAIAAADTSEANAAKQLAEIGQYTKQLEMVRATAHERLQENKSRLSHLEDHMRRLKDELGTLQVAAMELEAMANEHHDDRELTKSELERTNRLAEELKNRIADIEQEQRGKGKSYAIVPYEGRHGTYRPTLYIECRNDRVILQPEGIELQPSDFQPPLGAGNPLASALRAAREHLLRTTEVSPDKVGEPYPLILVRPDGIGSYYRVREAIRGWEADFGYELVDGDWNLTYPPASPEMAHIEQRAILEARARRQMLAEAAPRAYGGSGDSFEIEEELDGAESGYGAVASGGGSGAGYGPGGSSANGVGNEIGGNGSTGNGMQIGVHGGLAVGGQPGLADMTAQEGVASGDGASGPALAMDGARPGDVTTGAIHGEGGTGLLGPDGAATDAIVGGMPAPGQGLPSEQATSQGGNPSSPFGLPPNVGGPGGPAGSPSMSSAQFGAMGSMSPHAQNQSMQLAAGAPQMGGQASVNASHESAGNPSVSIDASPKPSRTHGKDWAIRNPVPSNVAIRRTVQVAVQPDQVAILPDQSQETRAVPNPSARIVPLEAGRVIPVDKFVGGLWQHMDQWGAAGSGLYWKPVLVLQVAPGAERRASELAQLLRNSGVEVRTVDTAQRIEQPNHASPR